MTGSQRRRRLGVVDTILAAIRGLAIFGIVLIAFVVLVMVGLAVLSGIWR